MKENKKYHGVGGSEAEKGFTDPVEVPIPPSDNRHEYAMNEAPEPISDESEGFLERQNTHDRI